MTRTPNYDPNDPKKNRSTQELQPDTDTDEICLSEWLETDPRPKDLIENPVFAEKVVDSLEKASEDQQDKCLEWAMPHLRELALESRFSSKFVQVFLRGGKNLKLLVELTPLVEELYASPHGNFVLTKWLEHYPQKDLQPIINMLEKEEFDDAAKHRYGCRLVERLLESINTSIEFKRRSEYIENVEDLSRHKFANYVILSLLETCGYTQVQQILDKLLPNLTDLAVHRIASHVVQQLLKKCAQEDRKKFVEQFLKPEGASAGEVDHRGKKTFGEVACNKYGSYVLESIHDALDTAGLEEDAVDAREQQNVVDARKQLAEVRQRLEEVIGSHTPKNDTEKATLVRVAEHYGLDSSEVKDVPKDPKSFPDDSGQDPS